MQSRRINRREITLSHVHRGIALRVLKYSAVALAGESTGDKCVLGTALVTFPSRAVGLTS